jgi:hypothetical protein
MKDKTRRRDGSPAAKKKGVPLPCKPDSVHPLRGWTVISLTPPRRGALLAQSATNTRRLTGGQPFPCSVLHHARFAVPSGYPDSRWALTPPFHPCLCPCGPSAVSFCCTVCPGSSRFPSLTFMRRVALWCPDFPHLRLRETATVRGAAGTTCGRRAYFPIKNTSSRNQAIITAPTATLNPTRNPGCSARGASSKTSAWPGCRA